MHKPFPSVDVNTTNGKYVLSVGNFLVGEYESKLFAWSQYGVVCYLIEKASHLRYRAEETKKKKAKANLIAESQLVIQEIMAFSEGDITNAHELWAACDPTPVPPIITGWLDHLKGK